MRTERKEQEKQSRVTAVNVITGLFLLAEAIFVGMMFASGIIPTKYLIFVIAILAIITFVVLKLLRSKKEVTRRRKAGGALAIILALILSVGSFYLYSTDSMFNSISDDDEQIEDFYAIVYKNSSYEKPEDMEGKTLFVTSAESDTYKQAKDKLKEEFSVKYQSAGDYLDLGQKLVVSGGSKDENIIFLSSTNYEMLCEDDRAFQENTKIIYTVSVKVENKDIAKRTEVTKDTFNVYISGIDTFGNIGKVSRSDVNMIMTVNPTEKRILLTSIPRDTYVTLHSYRAKDKLTHSGIYGIDETVTTVEDWLGVDINYYLRVNFTTLEDVVNVIGGVDVESEYTFKSSVSDYSYVKGTNHLDGKAALYFARERHAFNAGDLQRVRNQQLVIKGIIDKVMTNKSLLLKYPQLLGAVKNEIQTNMTDKEIASLVKMQLGDMTGWTIESSAITGDGTMAVTYSGGNQKLYVMIPDQESVVKAVEKIKAMSQGE